MAVYKRSYKAYRGAMTPAWSRFMVLARYGFATLFSSRPFTAYTVLCLVPFLVGLVFIYLVHSASVQTLLNVKFGTNALVDSMWFMRFLGVEFWMGFLLAAWGAPGMVSKDFANHSIQLYLSRPLSRAEYLLGKVSVLGTLLSCVTWIPLLILFGLQAQLEGNGWGWANLWMAGSIVVGGVLAISLIALLSMALSVWVRWRIAASALMFATFFFLPAFGEVFNLVLHTHWGRLINFPYIIVEIWGRLFRSRDWDGSHHRYTDLPLWSAWVSVLVACTICLWLLHRRLKAREVERG